MDVGCSWPADVGVRREETCLYRVDHPRSRVGVDVVAQLHRDAWALRPSCAAPLDRPRVAGHPWYVARQSLTLAHLPVPDLLKLEDGVGLEDDSIGSRFCDASAAAIAPDV